MAHAYISIGSNINPIQHIQAGIIDLRQQYGQLDISPVYESEAVGFSGNNFYNLIVAFATRQDPYEVNQHLRAIETKHGRQRSEQRFSSRTLDLDLVLYDNIILKNAQLELPRGEIIRYAFVLQPLADLVPDFTHPVTGQTYRDLWQAFDKSKQLLWQVNMDFPI
jgi:2-amino-4-hydroxy-6-hydroxymethyldihydropteridine diphosphokinase